MAVRVRSNQNPGRPEHNTIYHYQLKSGRDRFQIKRWWNEGSKHKNYIDCSGVELKGTDGCVFTLVWPHSYDTHLDVDWVAKFGTLTFTKFHRATRAALLCSDGSVLSHWKFGKIPGQKPMRFDINDSCSDGCTPGGGGTPPDSDHCWTIPELPTIDTDQKVADKSTHMFDICVDINALPQL